MQNNCIEAVAGFWYYIFWSSTISYLASLLFTAGLGVFSWDIISFFLPERKTYMLLYKNTCMRIRLAHTGTVTSYCICMWICIFLCKYSAVQAAWEHSIHLWWEYCMLYNTLKRYICDCLKGVAILIFYSYNSSIF